MTVLYKKEFTDTFNFYSSSNHCHSSLSFTCSCPLSSSGFWKIPSLCFTDSHALILWAHVRNQKIQFLEKQVYFIFFFKNWDETLQQIRNSVKSILDIFPIQFSYLSSCVDWEKCNKLGESKLKLSLLPSQIKTESYFSTHELLGPGLPIPLSLSNTFKHLTPCSFLQRQAQITDQFQGKRLEVVELTTGTCNAGFHALDSTGSCIRASQTPGEWLERHQFRTESLLIFF